MTETCPDCSGTGKVEGRYGNLKQGFDCPNCNGTGKVNPPQEEE